MGEGWTPTTLGEAVEVTMGRQRSPKHATGTHLVPYLRAANVKDGRLELDDVLEMNFTPEEQAKFALREGDVLVTEGCGSIAQLGASAAWNGDQPGTVCFQNTLLRLRARPGITIPGFVEVWARHAHHSGLWAAIASGTNILHIGSRRAEVVPILLPPVSEQRRIADIAATLDDCCRSTQAAIDAAERAASSVRNGLFTSLRDLPHVRADEMFEVTLGRQKSASQCGGDHVIPYLRAANVTDAGLQLGDVQAMNFDPTEQVKYGLRSGDVLVVEGGTVGNAALWTEPLPGPVGFDKHLLRFRPRPGRSTSAFALQWAHWSRESGSFAAQATGVTIKALGFGRASAMPVPEIGPDEQARLLAPVEAVDDYLGLLVREAASVGSARRHIVASLLAGAHEIPGTYDAFLGEAS